MRQVAIRIQSPCNIMILIIECEYWFFCKILLPAEVFRWGSGRGSAPAPHSPATTHDGLRGGPAGLRSASTCMSALAREDGVPVNRFVTSRMRSPASRLLQGSAFRRQPWSALIQQKHHIPAQRSLATTHDGLRGAPVGLRSTCRSRLAGEPVVSGDGFQSDPPRSPAPRRL